MQTEFQNSPDLDMLFDLFNEDFCEDMEHEGADSLSGDDNGDDTSSESSGSSGSSGHSSLTSSSVSVSSSPPKHISTYFPSPPAVVFATNPLSSFVSSSSTGSDCSGDTCGTSNKRTKTEDKLMRNRESANKSRLKRKNEKMQLEETVAALREKVRTLEMENTALLTDNTTLSQHNYFLQSMLKKQQEPSPSASLAGMQSDVVSPKNHMSALSGISMLCVVFSISFFNDWLPSALQSPAEGGEDNWSFGESSTGRVLLSVDDDDYSDSASISLLDSRSHQPQVSLHYVLLLGAMFTYYCYIQRCKAAEKKSSRLLPS